MSATQVRIRDTTLQRVGVVDLVTPEGVYVQWRRGWAEWMPKAEVNSGRYEQV